MTTRAPSTMGETPKPPARPVTMGETPKPPARPVPSTTQVAARAPIPGLPVKPAAPTISRADFEGELRRLREAHEQETANERCIECSACERCKDCTFCKASKALVRCHYCVDSQRCSDCTHCRGSKDLVSCNHCVACERCAQSSYLVKSVDCTGCTYCFGCVGLNRKDFHILNKPYDRSSYFAITARLAREMGLG